MKLLLCALFVCLCLPVAAQVPIPGGRNNAAIACVGTPGNTLGAYRQQCQTGAGAVYACNNAAGCATSADWLALGSVATVDANAIKSAWSLTDGGSVNTITGTTATTFPGAYAVGQGLIVKMANTNTGATTINVNLLGTVAVTKNGATALAAGNLVAGREYVMVYDGTQFQALNYTFTTGVTPNGNIVTFDVNGMLIDGGASLSGLIASVGTRSGTGNCAANQFVNVITTGVPNCAPAFALTTSGSSGAATFSGGTLNVPTYAGGSSAFGSITGGTNTTAVMAVGSGGLLGPIGTGGVVANLLQSGGAGALSIPPFATGYLNYNGSALAWSPGGGGGATTFSGLTDFAGTRTSSTTFTINPGNCRVGWKDSAISTTATITISGGTGSAVVFCDSTGALTVYHNLTLSCTNCTAVGGSTTVPDSAAPVWSMTATSGTWDVGNGVDMRASATSQPILQGSCILVTNVNGVYTIAFNSACLTTSGGVNPQTSNYTIVSGDSGKLVTMNGASLTATLPNPPPSATWAVSVKNLNASGLTVARNSLNINGGTANITLAQYDTIKIVTDGINYFSEVPLVAGSNITLTPASNGKTIASSGGGGGVSPSYWQPVVTGLAGNFLPGAGVDGDGQAITNAVGKAWQISNVDTTHLITYFTLPVGYSSTPTVVVEWSSNGAQAGGGNVQFEVKAACPGGAGYADWTNPTYGSFALSGIVVMPSLTLSLQNTTWTPTAPGGGWAGCAGKKVYLYWQRNQSVASNDAGNAFVTNLGFLP